MQPYFYRFISLLLITLSTTLSADEVSKKDTIESRYVYTLGYRVGQSLTAQNIRSLDMALFAQGVRDLLQAKSPASSQDTAAAANPNEHNDYLMGYRVAQSLTSQGIKHPEIPILIEGINASLLGDRPRLDELEMMDALSNFQAYQQALRENNAHAKKQMRNPD